MIVANQGPHFCAGANLMVILGFIMQNDWEAVRGMITGFQAANMRMRFCRGPVVAAPLHYTFGGGIEVCQHAARAVIAGETYGGLVEVGVGLIPAGGGTKEMLRRLLAYVPDSVQETNAFPYFRRAFEDIAMAKVSTSGAELIELGYFTENDVVLANFDHQVQKAKDVCRGLIVGGYKPPKPAALTVLGEPVRAAIRASLYNMQVGQYASEHDVAISMHVANILTGGDRVPGTKMSEQDALDLECEAFLSLCGTEKSQQRIQNMLASGKPLRN
jgi:3-hydroxyacyl-CoA dehydrogenase